MSRALFACSEVLQRWPARAPPSTWAGHFARLLKTAGWPRGRALDSTEFQAIERWTALLMEFSGLDGVSPTLSSRGALRGLGSLAARTVFQPRSPARAVQITGALEAAGLTFDHVWVSGLHAERWPPPPRPNPFLPVAVQRRYGLPNASNESQLEFARRVTKRLLGCAPRVVVSWPRQAGEAVLSPSPLIRPLEEAPAATLPGSSGREFVTTVFESGAMESLDTDPAPPLDDPGPTTGGSRLLQHQAQCPFRAFAQWRLGAHPLETPQIGIDPRLRGKIVHRALERLWREIRSHQSLLELSDGALDRRITAVCREAVADAVPGGSSWLRHLARLERDRLEGLLRLFLEEVCAGPLRLRTRVDRIDALADGGLAVIDYKTGEASPAHWFGERPEEPQLPLYAVTRTEEVAALLFAMLRPGAVGYSGLSRSPGLVPGAAAARGWEDTLENWRRHLAALGREFAAGAAAVAPKTPATCSYCHMASLCRIDALRARERRMAE